MRIRWAEASAVLVMLVLVVAGFFTAPPADAFTWTASGIFTSPRPSTCKPAAQAAEDEPTCDGLGTNKVVWGQGGSSSLEFLGRDGIPDDTGVQEVLGKLCFDNASGFLSTAIDGITLSIDLVSFDGGGPLDPPLPPLDITIITTPANEDPDRDLDEIYFAGANEKLGKFVVREGGFACADLPAQFGSVIFLGFGAVDDPTQGAVIPTAASPTLALSVAPAAVSPGAAFATDLSVANLGGTGPVDVYFGALLPAAVGPAFGCPGGDALAFFAGSLAQVAVTCASASPASFAALFRGVSIPALLPTTPVPGFFSAVWPPGASPGAYLFFMLLTPPDALTDGVIGLGELMAIGTAGLTAVP
jgi:hypothetical protein